MTPAILLTALLACTPPVFTDSGQPGDTALCTRYADADADGYGDPLAMTHSCDGLGTVGDGTDCDDSDPDIHPNADEYCNTLDDDCDGAIDEGDIPDQSWHRDRDADQFGVDDDLLESCVPPKGYAKRDGDCDDQDPSTFPGADEYCDLVDQDCDGTIDEEGLDAAEWYLDDDGDGHGVPGNELVACDRPDGYATSDDDCDDAASGRYPGNAEFCNNVDNDCDAIVDESAEDAPAWFLDSDGDGYGDADEITVTCDAPPGHVSDPTDCDDDDGTRYPGAPEVCDGDDEDCDSLIDEDAQSTFYRDEDGDGYGDADNSVLDCSAPSNYVSESGDCNDDDGGIRPGASEGCDGVDEDCDGFVDEDPVDGDTFYADGDSDGAGDPDTTHVACQLTTGWATTGEDCNDGDSTIYPGASEVCDSTDQDCDENIDEGVTTDFYTDSDGDGYGTPGVAASACSAPSGTVDNDQDCDDGDSTVNPDALEICDTLDQDCDSSIDEGVTTTFYADSDADGYGDPASTVSECSLPSSGYVENDLDCYDLNAAASPSQTAFFTTDRGDHSYDWTCDGVDEEEFPDEATCAAGVGKSACEGDPGWETSVPACGTTASWTEMCTGSANTDSECPGRTTEQTQSCR
jgi:hypothetical protein